MRVEIEPQDIDVVIQRVMEFLALPTESSRWQEIGSIAQRFLALAKPSTFAHDTPEPMGEFMNVETVAQYLGVKRSWIYDRTHRTAIPCARLGKYLRFRKSAIDDWLKACRGTRR